MVKNKVSVEKSELRAVIRDLRERGFSNREISKKIGARIDSYLYNNYNLSKRAFENLQELYGDEIRHEETLSTENNIKTVPDFEKNTEPAELSGIILGDGHLQERSEKNSKRNCSTYYLEITLHSGEERLIARTENLLKKVTDIEPKKYEKEGKCLRLVIHSKDAVEKFKELGLEPGSKKENQVGAPYWIKEDVDFCKSCVKGLIDTDGAIYQDQREKTSYTRIQFKNHSKTLLKDFKEMCSKIGVKTVKGGKYQVQVSRKDISKFIQEVEPTKAHQRHT